MAGKEVDEPDPVPYVETSAFTRLLGVGSRVKIIDVFLGKHYTALSISEVAELADLDVSTVHRNIQDIVEFGLIEKAGDDGRAQLYRLNKDSKIAQVLGRVRDELGQESDHIPRLSNRSEFLAASGRPSDIQDSLQNYTLQRTGGNEEGPRPSDYIDVAGEDPSSSLDVRGRADV